MILKIIDTETAQLGSGCCDLAVVSVNEDFEVVSRFESLVDPEMGFSPGAMGVHGITPDMVADEPTMEQLVGIHPNLFSPGDIYVGHNVGYDLRVLGAYLPKTYQKICTLRLAKDAFPSVENHKLQTLRYALGLEAGSAHRAMGDVITCLSLLKAVKGETGWSFEEMLRRGAKAHSPEDKIGFGKHKGVKFRDLPAAYIRWLLDKADNLDPDMRAMLVQI